MKAVVIREAGKPEVLRLEERSIPSPQPGWVLIKVKAFGLNRSELFTRLGMSPNVKFPRIPGIEAVGIVEIAPGGEFKAGEIVVTAMGGMGCEFDGSYAEYTCVPASQIKVITTTLDWETLGALPEMIQTAWGSLHTALQIEAGQSLLIRGGSSSVGLAAAILAKQHGLIVVATSRKPERTQLLLENGADHVVTDNGIIQHQIRKIFPNGVDRVLELVGTMTLLDSLKATAVQGIVCMTGMVGKQWSFDNFSPMDAIPTSVKLTCYAGGVTDFINTPLQKFIHDIETGTVKVNIGAVFKLNDIVRAHRMMEDNLAGGKIVVLTK